MKRRAWEVEPTCRFPDLFLDAFTNPAHKNLLPNTK